MHSCVELKSCTSSIFTNNFCMYDLSVEILYTFVVPDVTITIFCFIKTDSFSPKTKGWVYGDHLSLSTFCLFFLLFCE